MKVKGRAGADLESSQDFTLSVADTMQGQGRVLLMRFPITPGTCKVSARLDDMRSHKAAWRTPGRRPRTPRSAGEVEVPRPQAGRDLSDLEFVWPDQPRTPGLAFVRGGQARVPNPDRLYGLMPRRSRPRSPRALMPATCARGTGSCACSTRRAGSWRSRTARRRRAGWARARAFSLADQPAGAYMLDVKAWQEGDAGALNRRAKFSIGWQRETWKRNAADVADEVHFLLESRDEEEFTSIQPGEQERLLMDFWRKRDPTPETAMNEAYLTYRERVDFANEQFARFGIGKGMFSDMGRVYIRYGPPDEILHQVMPAGEETLSKALEEIMPSTFVFL